MVIFTYADPSLSCIEDTNTGSDLSEKLNKLGQSHLVDALEKLNSKERKELCRNIAKANLERSVKIFKEANAEKNNCHFFEYDCPKLLQWTSPCEPSELLESSRKAYLTKLADVPKNVVDYWRDIGYDIIGKGEVGCLILAGGDGTRLGWNHPKGMFPVAAISGGSLFQSIIEKIITLKRLVASVQRLIELPTIHIFIMTSEGNHKETVDFFENRDYFGLSSKSVHFFIQKDFPCFTKTGKVVLKTSSQILFAPNGNGDVFFSLKNTGVMDFLDNNKIKGLHVFGVENVLIKVLDPVFLGYVSVTRASVGNQCSLKIDPEELVGIFCERKEKGALGDSGACVIEYSELPPSIHTSRNAPNGDLTFSAANICNHFFSTDFIRGLVSDNDTRLNFPAHVAVKRIPRFDWEESRQEYFYGIKLEYFIFDCFPLADIVVGVEVPRESSFCPLKNREGQYSPQYCRESLSTLNKRWIQKANGKIEGDGFLEISHLVSYDGEGLEGFVRDHPVIKVPFLLTLDGVSKNELPE